MFKRNSLLNLNKINYVRKLALSTQYTTDNQKLKSKYDVTIIGSGKICFN